MLTEQVAACAAEMQAALADPDARRALCAIMQTFAVRQIRDRGLNEALLGSHAAGAPFAEQRRTHAQALEHLVDRARADGRTRPDLSVQDVRIGLRAIASFPSSPPGSATIALRKLTTLLLTGMSRPAPA